MDNGKIFITGFNSFDIVFLPQSGEIVSRFQGEHNVPMKPLKDEAEAKD